MALSFAETSFSSLISQSKIPRGKAINNTQYNSLPVNLTITSLMEIESKIKEPIKEIRPIFPHPFSLHTSSSSLVSTNQVPFFISYTGTCFLPLSIHQLNRFPISNSKDLYLRKPTQITNANAINPTLYPSIAASIFSGRGNANLSFAVRIIVKIIETKSAALPSKRSFTLWVFAAKSKILQELAIIYSTNNQETRTSPLIKIESDNTIIPTPTKCAQFSRIFLLLENSPTIIKITAIKITY